MIQRAIEQSLDLTEENEETEETEENIFTDSEEDIPLFINY